MRDYGKIFSRIWESQDFRSLSEDGRTLALYLLSCQHGTIAGVFRVPDGYACEDLQWSAERVSEGFANLSAKGFATRCGATKWVWVTKFLEWNAPENPNQRKAAAKVVASIPSDCCWKQAFMRASAEVLGLEVPEEAKGCETVSGPLLNQYQKQKQQQEQKQEKEETPRKRAASLACPADVAQQVWDDFVQHRKAKKATVSVTVIEGARDEARKAGIDLEGFLRIWVRRGSQGLEASWLKPEEIAAASGRHMPNRQEAQEQRNAEAAARWAESMRAQHETH